MSQNHRDPLERFATAVGGGKIRQVIRTKTDQEHYIYEVTGLANVQNVLGKLWPYLGSIKKDQARGAVRQWVEVPRTTKFRISRLTI